MNYGMYMERIETHQGSHHPWLFTYMREMNTDVESVDDIIEYLCTYWSIDVIIVSYDANKYVYINNEPLSGFDPNSRLQTPIGWINISILYFSP